MTFHPTLNPSFHPLPKAMLLACVTLLSACASLVTPSDHPLPGTIMPAMWSAASLQQTSGNPADLALWWQRFDDPALPALITQALQANTDVRSAQAALMQARAQADLQRAGLGPALGASASAQRSQTNGASPSNRFQVGFDASWEPDIFGGQRNAVQAGEADARAAADSLANVQVSLAAEVAVTTINLRALQARIAIARSNLGAQTDTLQMTRWRAQAGLVSSLDVEQAVTATEQIRAQIPALQTSLGQAFNALAVLTGQVPGTLNATWDAQVPIPAAPADIALAFPADTLRQRPDVRAAELRTSAALARVAIADAARYPSFRLNGSLGLSALSLGTLTHGASVLNTLMASVAAPLFDGGAAKAQLRVQEAGLEQSRVAYQAAVLGALQDVEDALVAIRGDRERLTHLQAAHLSAANAQLLARQQYNSGLVDFATVLNTQRSLLSAQDNEASALASLSTDHVRLYKALGGGWQPDAETRQTANQPITRK